MTANMLNDIRNLRENIEEDYYISSFFSVEVQHHLQHLVEHRIKLILKQTVIFHAGEPRVHTSP